MKRLALAAALLALAATASQAQTRADRKPARVASVQVLASAERSPAVGTAAAGTDAAIRILDERMWRSGGCGN